VVADEPVSPLDVSVGAQVLLLLQELEFGLTYAFISHSLPVVAQIATRVAVMRRGEIVGVGAADQVLGAPREAYTQELLASVPAI
jgi:peptide/nickel transport system ATP-binding protein